MEDYTINRYKIICKIGEGIHGVVQKAFDLKTKKYVAIKKLSLKTKHGQISLNTIREIKCLQHCNNEYIISLNDIFPDVIGLSLVFDFMPYTLNSKLKDEDNPLSRSDINSYTKMLLKGLSYLHAIGIMHRDIKPTNLLISEDNILKIGDFGLARLYDIYDHNKLYSPQVATRWYRCPEILWGSQKYGPPIDLWSVGCVFAEMLRGIPMFQGSTDIEQLAIVIKKLGTPKLTDWPELKTIPDFNKISFPFSLGENWCDLFPSFTTKKEIDLVANLLVYNPKKRLSASEALQHDYFF